MFQFCDALLEVPLISMNIYYLELTPESYNLSLKHILRNHQVIPYFVIVIQKEILQKGTTKSYQGKGNGCC